MVEHRSPLPQAVEEDLVPNHDLEVEGAAQEALVPLEEMGAWNLAEGVLEEVVVVVVVALC